MKKVAFFIFSQDLRILSALVPDNENIATICFSREIDPTLLHRVSEQDLVLVEISKSGISATQLQALLAQNAFSGSVWVYHVNPTLTIKRSLYEMGVSEVLGPDTDNVKKLDAYFRTTENS